ncbi:single-stranded-DNA-specific exonuclease RecJ [Candidatus Gracilibacteria bacterium]|nr:single-stranded-DNA-specific exonuclease RecJ [Candidatus Gracilibacteria bacterium]
MNFHLALCIMGEMKNQLVFKEKKWREAPEIKDAERLYEILLENRNLSDPGKIQSFLSPSLTNLCSPWEMKGMKKAVERILSAIDLGERIMVFGDFDADGITSTTILVSGLQELGAEVSYRIPDRHTESHGLKNSHVDKIKEKEVKLIITCDCGMNNDEAILYAKSLGIDTIVTDHHESDPKTFPHKAVAVLNPKQAGCDYLFKDLAGAGVAFKLISALAEKAFDDPQVMGDYIYRFLEICAIGLIADCVSLTGENRILARFGIEKLKTTKWPGLIEIFKQTNIDPRNIDAGTISFAIAPRLNAASRLGEVEVAIKLFLGDQKQHFQLVKRLNELNEERKELTKKAFTESLEQFRKEASLQMCMSKSWDLGILGLVASQYVAYYNIPSVVATIRPDGLLSASCRAPEGYSMIKALQEISDLFESFGGHDGAAGFLANPANYEKIQAGLDKFFAKTPLKENEVKLEAFITEDLLDFTLIDFLDNLAPFGRGNGEPIFGLKNVEVLNCQTVGNGQIHLRILGRVGKKEFNFMAFFADDFVDIAKVGSILDILFTVSGNYWNGDRRLQLRVEDLRKVD